MAADDWLTRSGVLDVGRRLTDKPDEQIARELDDAAPIPPLPPINPDGTYPRLPDSPAGARVRWQWKAVRGTGWHAPHYCGPDVEKLFRAQITPEASQPELPRQKGPYRTLQAMGIEDKLRALLEAGKFQRNDTGVAKRKALVEAYPEFLDHHGTRRIDSYITTNQNDIFKAPKPILVKPAAPKRD